MADQTESDGGRAQSAIAPVQPAPSADVHEPPPSPTAPPAPPPAAETVLKGDKTERELQLEAELETARRTIRDRETRVSELESDVQALKSPPAPEPPKRPRPLGVRLD